MEKKYTPYTLGYNTGERKDTFENWGLVNLEDRLERYDFMRKASGYTLTNSIRRVALAGFVHEADVTKFWAEYKKLCVSGKHEKKITFNTLMLKVIAESIKASPILNAHMTFNYTANTGNINYKKQIDVAMPMIFPNGRMLTLLVKDVGNKSLDEIAEYVADLERRLANTVLDETLRALSFDRMIGMALKGNLITPIASAAAFFFGPHKIKRMPKDAVEEYKREVKAGNTLTKDDVGEGTICISNVGSIYGGRGFATTSPILGNATSCMAFSKVQDEQFVYKDENGEVQIDTKKILPFTLLFDHKIGGLPDCVPFLHRMDEIFQNPEIIHTW